MLRKCRHETYDTKGGRIATEQHSDMCVKRQTWKRNVGYPGEALARSVEASVKRDATTEKALSICTSQFVGLIVARACWQTSKSSPVSTPPTVPPRRRIIVLLLNNNDFIITPDPRPFLHDNTPRSRRSTPLLNNDLRSRASGPPRASAAIFAHLGPAAARSRPVSVRLAARPPHNDFLFGSDGVAASSAHAALCQGEE
jgi:hypothetical protein